VRWGVGRLVRLFVKEVAMAVVFLMDEIPVMGEDSREEMVLASISTSNLMFVSVIFCLRFGGDAVLCLFGDLVLDLVLAMGAAHVGGDSRNGMILFARVIGYEKAMTS
jgi:hypothetical protein